MYGALAHEMTSDASNGLGQFFSMLRCRNMSYFYIIFTTNINQIINEGLLCTNWIEVWHLYMYFVHVHYKRCPSVYAMRLTMTLIIIQVYCIVISFTKTTHIYIQAHTKINLRINALVIFYTFFSNISQANSTKINIISQVWAYHYFKWQVTSSIAVISH